MKTFILHKGNVKLFSSPTLTPKQLNIAPKGTTNLKLNKKFNSFVTLNPKLNTDQYLKKVEFHIYQQTNHFTEPTLDPKNRSK